MLLQRLFWLFLGCVFPASWVLAEVVCRSNVSYQWRKADEEELRSFWSSLERSAATEEAAKSLLTAAGNDARRKALAECRQTHENLAGCMSTKFASNAAVLRNMSFRARQELEEAIAMDCKSIQGVCLEVLVTEPECQVMGAEAKTVEDTGGAPAKKGDK